MTPPAFYDVDKTRRYFDRWGWLMWLTNSLDAPIYRQLLRLGQFEQARLVLEIGAGRGPFARQLLRRHEYQQAHLVCTEISPILRRTLLQRLRPWAERCTLLDEAGPVLSLPSESFDRFVACFVLDIMDETQQVDFLNEAHRLLKPGGRICLMTVCDGIDWLSRPIMRLGKWLAHRSPWLALGARYRDLGPLLTQDHWEILECRTSARMGCATKLTIARKRSGTITPSPNC